MIFRDNTATNGYCLCSDCRFKSNVSVLYENGVPIDITCICRRYGIVKIVKNVGICNLFEGRVDNETR